MTQQQFNDVFSSIFTRCREILCDKAKEYAGGGDRLKNFRVSAELQGIVLFCSREERQATATESSVHRITVQLLLHV